MCTSLPFQLQDDFVFLTKEKEKKKNKGLFWAVTLSGNTWV